MRAPDFSAEEKLEAEADEVFAFLSDLENHWRLTGRSVRVLELEASGRLGALDPDVEVAGPERAVEAQPER